MSFQGFHKKNRTIRPENVLNSKMTEIIASKSLWALFCAYIFCLPLGTPIYYRFVLVDIFAIIALAILFKNVVIGSSLKFERIDGFFGLFIGFSLLGLDISKYPYVYIFDIGSVIYLFCCFRMTSYIVCNEQILFKIIRLLGYALVIVLLINTLAVTINYFQFSNAFDSFFTRSQKLCWPFEFSGQLGIMLPLLFPVYLCTVSPVCWKRMSAYFMLVMCAGSVGSRSVFMLCIAEIVIIEFFHFRLPSRPLTLLKNICFIIIVSLPILLIGSIYPFSRSMGQLDSTPLTFDLPRYNNIISALDSGSFWLLGQGLGCFGVDKLEIHNTPLALIVETGIGGFLVAIIAFYIVSNTLIFRKIYLSSCQGLIFGLRLALFSLIIQSLLRNLITSRVSWLILALCYCLNNFIAPFDTKSSKLGIDEISDTSPNK